MEAGKLFEPVLVARERELGLLQRYLDSALSGKGRTVFISGEAGSGKTRIAREFLNSARKKNVTILDGWCLSNAAIPYFPFLEAFDSWFPNGEEQSQVSVSQQSKLKSWLGQTVPTGSGEKFDTVNPQAWRYEFFAAITRELLVMSTLKPLILFIDDLHWADSASLALLHYISRAIASESILILATFRSEELNSVDEGYRNSLIETLHLMGREGLFEEINLLPLSSDDIEKIAESMLRGPVHTNLVDKLSTESAGNPLFVVESLKSLTEQGNLIQDQGLWNLSAKELDVPSKVRDLILRRYGSLKLFQKRVLDVASVIGDKFDPRLISAVLSQESIEVFEALNSIVKTNSMIRYQEKTYQFDHPITREMLYEEILPPLRQEYHFRIAERLEAANRNAAVSQSGILAHHYRLAENPERAIKYSLKAGKEALAAYSNAEAVNHFKYVISAAEGNAEYAAQLEIALEGIGRASLWSSHFEESVRSYERLSDITKSETTKLRAFAKAMEASYWQGNRLHTLELADKAQAYMQPGKYAGKYEKGRVEYYKGMAIASQGRVREALKLFEASLEACEEVYALADMVGPLVQVGLYRREEGREQENLAGLLRAVALSEELEELYGTQTWTCANLGAVFSHYGLYKEAIGSHKKTIEIGEKIGSFGQIAWGYFFLGTVYEAMEDFKSAVAFSLKGVDNAEKTDQHYVQFLNYANLTRQYAFLGEIENSEKWYRKLEKIFVRKDLMKDMLASGLALCSKAVLLTAKREYNKANEVFEGIISRSKNAEYDSFSVQLTKPYYAWSLFKQKHFFKAKKLFDESQRRKKELEKIFNNSNIQAHLVVQREAEIGSDFKARLDVVNVSKSSCSIIAIKELITPKFKVAKMPPYLRPSGAIIEMDKVELGPFKVEPIKMVLQAVEAGNFTLSPQVMYIDNRGKTQISRANSITVTIRPKQLKTSGEFTPSTTTERNLETAVDSQVMDFEFKTEASEKVFDFLVNAFLEDYMKRRIASERAGWRTLMEIAKDGKISTYRVYGEGRGGSALTELQHRGIVETRIFPGERGRGGKILKARICYDKEPIKRYTDRRVYHTAGK